MNLPNRLTLLRMILTPVFLIVFLTPAIPYAYFIGLGVYIAGCITDFLDGKIARKYQLITAFGKLADPIADKMLTTAALLALMKLGYCSIYIVFVILTREFAVTTVRLAASAQGIVIPANIWGKCKTVSQMVFTILIMAAVAFLEHGLLPQSFPLFTVSQILLGISAVLAVVSGIIYIVQGIKSIDMNKV